MQAACKQRGLKASGSKDILRGRLLEDTSGGSGLEPVAEAPAAGTAAAAAPTTASGSAEGGSFDDSLSALLGLEGALDVGGGGSRDAGTSTSSSSSFLDDLLAGGEDEDSDWLSGGGGASSSGGDGGTAGFWERLAAETEDDQGLLSGPSTSSYGSAMGSAFDGGGDPLGGVQPGGGGGGGGGGGSAEQPLLDDFLDGVLGATRGAPAAPSGGGGGGSGGSVADWPGRAQEAAEARHELALAASGDGIGGGRINGRAVLRAYGKWVDVASLEEKKGDAEAFACALEAAAATGQGDAAEGVLADLKQAALPVDARSVRFALAAHAGAGASGLGAVLALLRNAEAAYGTGPTDATHYVSAGRAFAQARHGPGGLESALRVVDAMRAAGVPGDLEVARVAVNAASRLGDAQRALDELQHARDLITMGERPQPAAPGDFFVPGGGGEGGEGEGEVWDVAILYTSAMAALNQARQSRLVYEVFLQMEQDDVDPNGTGYGLAVSACARVGQRDESALKECVRLLMEAHELRDELVPPVDTRAYLAVLDAHAYAGEPLGAALALEAAEDADLADSRCYERAISAAGKAGRYSQAMAHLKSMRGVGLRPSVEAYNSVIGAFEKGGKLRQAMPLLEEMRLQGIATDAVTYNIALRACGGRKDWERAEALLEEMAGQGVAPTAESYDAVAVACANARNLKRALLHLDAMEAAGLAPDRATFAAVLRAAVEEKPKVALDVLARIKRHDLGGDKTTGWAIHRLTEAATADEDEGDDENENADADAAAVVVKKKHQLHEGDLAELDALRGYFADARSKQGGGGGGFRGGSGFRGGARRGGGGREADASQRQQVRPRFAQDTAGFDGGSSGERSEGSDQGGAGSGQSESDFLAELENLMKD